MRAIVSYRSTCMRSLLLESGFWASNSFARLKVPLPTESSCWLKLEFLISIQYFRRLMELCKGVDE